MIRTGRVLRKEKDVTERIGFIGLGIMGRGMAANLLKAGFSLTVWNRTIARMDDLVAQGAHAGASPADVAARSNIIVICVSDTPDVQAVVLGEDGVIAGAAPGALVVDCSTISPQATREMAVALTDPRRAPPRAPLTGGQAGAAALGEGRLERWHEPRGLAGPRREPLAGLLPPRRARRVRTPVRRAGGRRAGRALPPRG